MLKVVAAVMPASKGQVSEESQLSSSARPWLGLGLELGLG